MSPRNRAVDLALPVGARDHVQGASQAPLTLVEYGDYECSQSGRAYPIVKAVRRRFGSKLRFVFRNFPLAHLHPHAELAAEVAEAAAAHGKFWEMHDMLFENQRALGRQDLIAYVTELGVDILISELQQRAYRPRITEDLASGEASGVHGAPAFFINGVRFEGTWDEPGLIAALWDAYDTQELRASSTESSQSGEVRLDVDRIATAAQKAAQKAG